MKNINLKKLKQLALAAIPGPWKLIDDLKDEYTIGVSAPWSDKVKPSTVSGMGDCRGIHICETHHQNDNPCVSKAQAFANMEFIAAANPEIIIELINALESAKSDLNKMIDAKVSAIDVKPGDILVWRQQGKTGRPLEFEIEMAARRIRKLFPENPLLISADDSQLEVMSDELLDQLGLMKKQPTRQIR